MSGISTPEEQSAYDALSKRDRRLVDAYLSNGMVQWKAYRDVFYSGGYPDYDHCSPLASRKFQDDRIQAAIRERLDAHAMGAEEVLARLTDEARACLEDFYQLVPGTVYRDVWRPVAELAAELEAKIEDEEAYAAEVDLTEEERTAHEARLRSLRHGLVRYRIRLRRNPEATEQQSVPAPGLVPELDLEQAERRGKIHLLQGLKYNAQGRPQIEIPDPTRAKELLGKHHGLFREQVDVRLTEPIRVIDFSPEDPSAGDPSAGDPSGQREEGDGDG